MGGDRGARRERMERDAWLAGAWFVTACLTVATGCLGFLLGAAAGWWL